MKVYINTTFTVDHGLYGKVSDMYNHRRLKFRLKTLRDVVLPSVASQTYKNIEHRVFYSDRIDKEIEDSLLSLSSERSKFIKLGKGREPYFEAARTPDSRCIHINLDDDDSLSPWYVEFLVEASKFESGEVIMTFLDGVVVNWKEESTDEPLKTFFLASRMFYSMNNHGLAILTSKGRGTHELSNHTKILKNFPEIKLMELTNNGKVGWVRTESNNSHHKTYHPHTLVKPPYLKVKTIEEVYAL